MAPHTASNSRESDTAALIWLLTIVVAVNALGIFNDVMSSDSSLYASIAKRFVVSGDFLNIYVNGRDWLDKPHFPFWMAALSMRGLGVSAFAYKLPSFLFFLLSLLYTYRLAREAYDKQTALTAAAILSSALHIIISNNDVRAEGYLLGTLMGSVYHLRQLLDGCPWKHLLIGALWAAAAVMTKGIFTLAIPIAAVAAELIGRGRWRELLQWRWAAVAALILIFITPELYTLYSQFDLHPEKEVLGQKGVSGIQFFFIGSQLHRFLNIGPIVQDSGGSPFFFLHTLLWAFAPWALFFYASLAHAAIKIGRGVILREYASFGASVLGLIMFSASSFQLPHYTNILMPFFAIQTASFLLSPEHSALKTAWLKYILLVLAGGLLAVCTLLSVWMEPETMLCTIAPFLLAAAIYALYPQRSSPAQRWIAFGCSLSIAAGLYLNLIFYPRVMAYQGQTQAARYVNQYFPKRPVAIPSIDAWLFDFYIKNYTLKRYDLAGPAPPPMPAGAVMMARKMELERLTELHIPYRVEKVFDDFSTTQLTSDFLHRATRASTLRKVYLIEILPWPAMNRRSRPGVQSREKA